MDRSSISVNILVQCHGGSLAAIAANFIKCLLKYE